MQRLNGLLLGALITTSVNAETPLQLKTEQDKVNYSIGFQIGGDFIRQKMTINETALIQGIKDALKGDSALMTTHEMQTTLIDLKKRIIADQQKEKLALKQLVRDEGKAFLKENAKRNGIVTLPSGLQYKVIEKGQGNSPTADQHVTVHYKGTLTNGNEFDSSFRKGKPANFQVDKVIPGWTEALQLMKEGDHWELFIPSELAYGERGPLADQTLIFDVTLVSVDEPTSKN